MFGMNGRETAIFFTPLYFAYQIFKILGLKSMNIYNLFM